VSEAQVAGGRPEPGQAVVPTRAVRQSRQLHRSISLALAYLVTTILALLFLFPFLWMASSSLKTPQELVRIPPTFIPESWAWGNYIDAWKSQPFLTYFRNSTLITALNVLGRVISCSLVAFGFARTRFPGRNFLFVILLSTMMLPTQVTLIPQYLLFRHLNWINTIKPLTVPAFFGSAFHVFLLRQFFMNLPLELDEAAFMDGANRWSIYWRIVMPLSRPILLTVLIFTFINSWNDFFGPLLYLSTVDQMTIAVGLLYFRDQFGAPFHYLMASSVMAVVPIIIVFFLAQRYFISSIIMTGLREG
jgi:ABC-type glycerol-3-phosphate transport system permease component